MGAANAIAAFTLWEHLPHAAFRLLVGMALHALDAPSKEGRPARVYFGGEDGLVAILGRSRSQMYEALSRLRDAGAVTILEPGRSRHRAVYRLNLDILQCPGNPDTEGSRKPGHEASRKPGHTGSRKPGPLGTTVGSTGKSRLGDTSPPEVPHQGAGSAVDEADDDAYSRADQKLQSLGPDGYGRALEAAFAANPDASTRDLVIAAAEQVTR